MFSHMVLNIYFVAGGCGFVAGYISAHDNPYEAAYLFFCTSGLEYISKCLFESVHC
jgi:hypothetical protein